jgi:hypothetical protein
MTILAHPFLFFIFISHITFSQFDFNKKEVQEAYKNILKLKTEDANKQLLQLRDTAQFKKNGIVPLLENYLDVISILATENKSLYKKLKNNQNTRLKELKNYKQNSPYYLYSQADIRLQWAFVELIFEDYINGFINLKKANDLINDNIKRYPNFKLNNKVKGLIDLLTEAAPSDVDWALSAAGLHRSTKGSDKLTETTVYEPFFKAEIDIYLSLVNAYVKNDPDMALWKIEKTYKDNKDNLFALFTYANILSQLKMNQNILVLLQENPLHRKKGYLYIPYLDYLWGESYLNIMQLDKGINTLRVFLNKSKENSTFCAYSCFKIALAYSSQKKSDSSNFFIQKIKTYTKNELYLDLYAHHFSENKLSLEPTLSLSRLEFDAGRYQECYDLLKKTADYKNNTFNTEKYYRLASCAKLLSKNTEYPTYFEKCVKSSNTTDANYFAAYASLQLGYHYQTIKKNDLAIKYFKQAKTYKTQFYYSSVKEKADTKLKDLVK